MAQAKCEKCKIIIDVTENEIDHNCPLVTFRCHKGIGYHPTPDLIPLIFGKEEKKDESISDNLLILSIYFLFFVMVAVLSKYIGAYCLAALLVTPKVSIKTRMGE